jgi:glycosyltransferase involved in cell wall biosynthesis
MRSVHQFVPTLEPGAVGQHVVQIAHVLEEMGIESTTFAEHIRPSMTGRASDFRDYGRGVPAKRDDVLLYHVAIGSTVADFVRDQPARLVLDHHNITPPAFWTGWEPAVVSAAAWARRQLAELAPRAELGIADSHFSEHELVDEGCRATMVLPVMVDLDAFEAEVDEVALDRLHGRSAGAPVWLFVGRLAPNKCQHDIIKAFWAYRSVYDPSAVLRLVGATSSPRYLEVLHELVGALQLESAVEITGGVSAGELSAHYRAADVLVCLSEHEGFCVPLLEAMHHELPVIAYAATAVPETLGDGGLCLPTKAPSTVASAVNLVLRDVRLRRQLVDAGTRRMAAFDLDVTRAMWRDALASLAAP